MSSNEKAAVLLVEDERIIARDLAQMLEEMGYEAMAIASSAEEAIAAATARCPDVVLMDIRIAGDRDGIATAEILRSRFGVPVIFLTAHADRSTLMRAKATEPHGYLVKPVKAVEVRGMIEVALHRHRLERQLRERERWFSTTLRSIADAVVAVDLDGKVTFMNPTAEKLTGVREPELLGHPLGAALNLVEHETAVTRAFRERHAIEPVEGRIRSADGSVRYVTKSTAPVMDHEQPLGAVTVLRDITEQRELRLQLERADRLSSLGTMAAGVAHEINNPLAIVSANADYLEQQLGELETGLREGQSLETNLELLKDTSAIFRDVQLAVERISRIVSDLRVFSRPRPTDSGLSDIARCIEWATRATANELRHRAKVLIDLEDLPPVHAEEPRLVQVIINLFVNAGQAIPPGDTDRNVIAIRGRRVDSEWVELELTDTGAGMTPETLSHAFEPFFTTKEHGQGTGLGLSICHGIVKSFGGDISVESKVDQGTTFRIRLLAARNDKVASLSPTSAAMTSQTRQKFRACLFVIDDDPTILAALQRILSEHDVRTFQDPHVALDAIGQGDLFDIVLCDVMMPTMTGMEFYERLRAQSEDLAKRVIFSSGGVIGTPLESFVHAMGSSYVEKPFRPEELESRIRDKLAILGRRTSAAASS